MQYFKNLEVYRKAFGFSFKVYKEIMSSSNTRLKSQLFGSTTSICANLAEFAAFDSRPQKKHKLRICIGESNETEFWLDFCAKIRLIDAAKAKEYAEINNEIRKMLYSLMRKV